MKVDLSQTIAIFSLPIMLGLAGLGTFFWMAGTDWSDMTGVGVGIIYVVLTVIQVIFTIAWWRIMRAQPEPDLVKLLKYSFKVFCWTNMHFVGPLVPSVSNLGWLCLKFQSQGGFILTCTLLLLAYNCLQTNLAVGTGKLARNLSPLREKLYHWYCINSASA